MRKSLWSVLLYSNGRYTRQQQIVVKDTIAWAGIFLMLYGDSPPQPQEKWRTKCSIMSPVVMLPVGFLHVAFSISLLPNHANTVTCRRTNSIIYLKSLGKNGKIELLIPCKPDAQYRAYFIQRIIELKLLNQRSNWKILS